MKEKGKKITLFGGVLILAALALLSFRACSAAWEQGDQKSIQNEQPTTIQEPAGSVLQNPGKYQNETCLTWTAPSGKTISAGLENGKAGDAIYLNLRCSGASKDGNEIGFYLKSDRGLLEYSDWTVGLSGCDSGTNADSANFYIPQQMYNLVGRMEYEDEENYGVKWSDDGSDGTIAGAIISARAINLKTAELIGICDIEIAYDESEGTYFIEDLRSADVRESGLLSEEDREDAIQKAIQFAEENLFNSGTLSKGNWQEAALAGSVVHGVDHTYFARLLDTEGQPDKFVNHYTCQDTYAVTMPVSIYGYVTVYLAPETECMGLTEPTLYDSDELNLTVYGYDPLNPRDEESIIAPIYFFSM